MSPSKCSRRHEAQCGIELLSCIISLTFNLVGIFLSFVLCKSLMVIHSIGINGSGKRSRRPGIHFGVCLHIYIYITSAGLWSQKEVESTVMDIHDQETSTENLKVPDVDGDGLTFLAAKFWLNWFGSGARRSKLVLKSWKTDNEYIEPQAESSTDSGNSKPAGGETETKVDREDTHNGFPITARESFKAAVIHFCSKWHRHLTFILGHAKRLLGSFRQLWHIAGMDLHLDIPKWLRIFYLERLNSFAVQWLERRSKAFEPTYLYTMEKGYFLLPEGAKSRHNVHTVNISISARHSCFGNRWQQLLINRFVGYDTILMNSLLSSPGQGYLYNYQTKEFYDLSYAHESAEGSARFGDYFVTKCGVLMMSLFVFFTTTMSVSFTLRETQARMLKFTVQLQHHARHRLPTFQLIFVHVIESLVFVPIMIGILFFLFEFYDDQLLAFMVLILVWLCELFTLISVRTPISAKFFPRFFLLYFLVFHIYFFSYAYGFSYLAFSTTAAFMQHLILYFWNRFEVPALQRFTQNRRSQLQQHPDFHITSSTILASTLHITRLNMRNPGPVNSDPGPRPGPDLAREPNGATEASVLQEPLEINNSDRVGRGASSEGLNNFLSMELVADSSINCLTLGGAIRDTAISLLGFHRRIKELQEESFDLRRSSFGSTPTKSSQATSKPRSHTIDLLPRRLRIKHRTHTQGVGL
ncbi:hypothetical protein HHK36_004598 [Tetracentron sinense]|uniref:Membralin n=1 Tax=Tetracentron sinense TaxID=13715 RepID=A0A835DQG4_TETSI|nr:hypothetical protein HHK36_004598 [Tetracentron sinense]